MKRTLCLALALLLLLPLAACAGGDKQPDAPATTAGGADSTTPEPETTAAPEPYYLDVLSTETFGGRTVVMIGESYDQRPNFCLPEYTGATINDALYDRQLALEARYEVKIETLPQSSRGNVNTLVIKAVNADDDAYDLVFNSMIEGANVLMSSGLLAALSSQPHLDFSQPWWAPTMIKNFTVNGRIYIAVGGSSPSYYLSAVCALFNKQKAVDYGLPALYPLVLDGKWTIDRLGEAASMCLDDLNGDGRYDAAHDFLPFVINSEAGRGAFVSAGGVLIERDEQGQYYLDLASEKNLFILDKLRAVIGDRTTSTIIDSSTGKIAPFVEEHAMFALTTMMFAAQELRDMTADYGILPMPKLDDEQKDYITFGNTYAPCGSCIPRSASDPAMSALILEAMAFLGEEYLRPAIYNVTLNGKIAQDKETSQMLEIIYRDIVFDFNAAFNLADTAQSLRSYALGKVSDFVSIIAKLGPKADKALADLMEAMEKYQ